MPKIAAADIDLANAEPVLHFTGEQAPGDVPHRDLTAADLLYIARVRALRASGGEPVGDITPGKAAAAANDLLEHGGFNKSAAPAIVADPAPTPADTTAPVSPAEEI